VSLTAKHAEAAAVVFKEHDALKLMECWGDDMLDGKVTSFPMAVKKQADETVVFSWDPLALARGARRRHEEGDGRPAPSAEREPDALRRQAPDLRRIGGE
jgi:uncharacterized protein YbaA (DUF1428 family)